MVFWRTLLVIFLLRGPIPTEGINSSACYNVVKCDNMSLSCPGGKIFILRIRYGKKSYNACSPHCNCCQPEESDCVLPYTDLQFGLVFHQCWNVRKCSFLAQGAPQFCTGYPLVINVADYSCLGDDDITAFHENITVTAPAVAVHYDHKNISNYPVASEGNQTWHCQVDSADCVQRRADVILVKENYTGSMSHCSSLGWSGGNLFSCGELFMYDSFNTTTPFLIRLQVNGQHRPPSGWAVIRAQDDKTLKVTCGFTTLMTVSHCPGTTDNQPTAATLTSFGSSYASSVMDGQSESPLDAGSNTGPIVGGVLAAVVVLVAAVLGVFCYVKRCRQQPESDPTLPSIQKSSMHLPLTSLSSGNPSSTGDSESAAPNNHDDDDGDYDRIGRSPKPQNGHATALGIPGNQKSPAENPDYDLLGQKKPQRSSSNPAATYGRLGEVGGGGEDTDYSYDHLARGRQAGPDVIDSDYNTPGLTSENDYNVAGIPKKQHVITGSDYDTAEIVTSDGDYNRVDFQGRKQKAVTGSDYNKAEIMTSDNAESDVTPGTSTRIKVDGGTTH